MKKYFYGIIILLVVVIILGIIFSGIKISYILDPLYCESDDDCTSYGRCCDHGKPINNFHGRFRNEINPSCGVCPAVELPPSILECNNNKCERNTVDYKASELEPLKIDKSKIKMIVNKKEIISVSFYCKSDQECKNFKPSLFCKTLNVELITPPFSILSQEEIYNKAIIEDKGTKTLGSEICTIEVSDNPGGESSNPEAVAKKDILIEVIEE